MMKALAGDSPHTKWVAVNRATTKRYVSLLKRLSLKVWPASPSQARESHTGRRLLVGATCQSNQNDMHVIIP